MLQTTFSLTQMHFKNVYCYLRLIHINYKYIYRNKLIPLLCRQWTESTLVQMVPFRLLGAKQLPEPMPTSCELDPQEQISANFESQF